MLARDIYCRLFSGVLRLKYSGQIFMIVAFLSAARGKSRGQFLSSLSQCSTTLLTERDRSERNPSIYHRGFFSIVAQGRNVRKFVGVSSAVPCFRSHRVSHLEIHSIEKLTPENYGVISPLFSFVCELQLARSASPSRASCTPLGHRCCGFSNNF